MYTIAEMADKFNVSKNALRYYESEGLIPPIARDNNGIRKYTDDNIQDINRVIHLRNLGATIKETKWFNDEFSKEHPDYDEGLAFLERLNHKLDQKVAEIDKQREFLNHKTKRLQSEKADEESQSKQV